MTTMSLDLDLIFPIRDVPSADLMMLKAACLWNAGLSMIGSGSLFINGLSRFLRRDLAVTTSWPSAGSSLAASPHAA
jgi:hypothetical protein